MCQNANFVAEKGFYNGHNARIEDVLFAKLQAVFRAKHEVPLLHLPNTIPDHRVFQVEEAEALFGKTLIRELFRECGRCHIWLWDVVGSKSSGGRKG